MHPAFEGHSRSSKLTLIDPVPDDFLLVIPSKHVPSRNISEIMGDFGCKMQSIPTHMYLAPHRGLTLEFCDARRVQKHGMVDLPNGKLSLKIGTTVLIQY